MLSPDPTSVAEGRSIVESADRPVDPVRAARVFAVVGGLLAALIGGAVEHLLRTADDEPIGSGVLRRGMTELRPASSEPSRLAVVLVDGMRADEAVALPSWGALASRGAWTGRVALEMPSLSRPFEHVLLTGVPIDASGIRSNRFVHRARHDSLTDRVRAARGSVLIVSQGLDWLRRMHGASEDGGSDAADALDGPLDDALDELTHAAPPALLLVHHVTGDQTAHDHGVRSEEHRAALRQADRVIERIAELGTRLVVLSDHGHLESGGHGGPEREVALAPILIRGLAGAPSTRAVPAVSLAPTLARLVGVAPPLHATAPAVGETADARHARAEAAFVAGRRAEELRLEGRRRWMILLALAFLVLTLGPIKRAFGFDRGVVIAVLLWPLVVVLGHLALGRPLSLSAIDDRAVHIARVVSLGALGALLAIAASRWIGRGPPRGRVRRGAAAVGWVATGSFVSSATWAGFALGPWPLTPIEFYLPLLSGGAAIGALVVASGALALERRGAQTSGGRASSV
ncbi:MAG: alkaline phosphatase family protein [Sandaracinaceae bacterium]